MDQPDRDQICPVLFVKAVQIRLVLKEIGIYLPLGNLLVGLYIICKYLDIEGQTLGFQIILYVFQNFGMRYRRGSNTQGIGLGNSQSKNGNNGTAQKVSKHKASPKNFHQFNWFCVAMQL